MGALRGAPPAKSDPGSPPILKTGSAPRGEYPPPRVLSSTTGHCLVEMSLKNRPAGARQAVVVSRLLTWADQVTDQRQLVVGLFREREQADEALAALRRAGFVGEDVSLLS